MSTFQCPHCRSHFILYEGKNFFSSRIKMDIEARKEDPLHVIIYHFICSNSDCKIPVIIFTVVDNEDRQLRKFVYPEHAHSDFVQSIPESLGGTYEKALALSVSDPKASARLANQCVQGMLRDVWNVTPGSLHEEIEQIRDMLDEDVLTSLDSVYNSDNIGRCLMTGTDGAVDCEEAELMLRLVELLGREWYLHRDRQRHKRAEIVALAQQRMLSEDMRRRKAV